MIILLKFIIELIEYLDLIRHIQNLNYFMFKKSTFTILKYFKVFLNLKIKNYFEKTKNYESQAEINFQKKERCYKSWFHS